MQLSVGSLNPRVLPPSWLQEAFLLTLRSEPRRNSPEREH
jgi:hypothetical protein